jgi:hydrogenase nickel incorporation protein HypA/HybF
MRSTRKSSLPMHELSIALSILEIAEEEAARRGGARVTAVHLKLGPLSGVVPRALVAAYELAREGSPLATSELVVKEVPLVAFCPQCRAERMLESIQCFCCPICGTATSEIVSGRELEIIALELLE